MATWTKGSPYHWTSAGWTIARIIMDGQELFELWDAGDRNNARCVFRCGSLKAADKEYGRLTGNQGPFSEEIEEFEEFR